MATKDSAERLLWDRIGSLLSDEQLATLVEILGVEVLLDDGNWWTFDSTVRMFRIADGRGWVCDVQVRRISQIRWGVGGGDGEGEGGEDVSIERVGGDGEIVSVEVDGQMFVRIKA